MMCSSRHGLFGDDLQVALARRRIDGVVAHLERLDVAADRRKRGRQFVRHVGEELAAGAIGGLERARAILEPARHVIEGVRERRHLVAAVLGSADAGRAFAERRGRILQRSKAAVRGPEDHERGDRDAGDKESERHRREHRSDVAQQDAPRRRAGGHADGADGRPVHGNEFAFDGRRPRASGTASSGARPGPPGPPRPGPPGPRSPLGPRSRPSWWRRTDGPPPKRTSPARRRRSCGTSCSGGGIRSLTTTR